MTIFTLETSTNKAISMFLLVSSKLKTVKNNFLMRKEVTMDGFTPVGIFILYALAAFGVYNLYKDYHKKK